MRELKFRAWYLTERQYVHFSGIFNNRPIVNQLCEMRDGKLVTTISYGGQIIEQYTGLKDKNGKEIYEGDVLHCVSRMDSADMVVIFADGEFRMVLLEKYERFNCGDGFYAIRCFDKEVIGNIHEQAGDE